MERTVWAGAAGEQLPGLRNGLLLGARLSRALPSSRANRPGDLKCERQRDRLKSWGASESPRPVGCPAGGLRPAPGAVYRISRATERSARSVAASGVPMQPRSRNGASECVDCGALVYGGGRCFLCGGATAPLTPEIAINAASRLAAKWTEQATRAAPFARFWGMNPPSHLDEKHKYEEAREAVDGLRAAIRALKA